MLGDACAGTVPAVTDTPARATPEEIGIERAVALPWWDDERAGQEAPQQ